LALKQGLPQDVLDQIDDAQRLRMPAMRPGNRSLNCPNAAVVVCETWRQHDFAMD
jgi:tRNA (cytidine/uridine-2'-O-)-methyltransferase